MPPGLMLSNKTTGKGLTLPGVFGVSMGGGDS